MPALPHRAAAPRRLLKVTVPRVEALLGGWGWVGAGGDFQVYHVPRLLPRAGF